MTPDEMMIKASGFFLCVELPEDYGDWEPDTLDDFLINYAWEPFENLSADELWDNISMVFSEILSAYNEGVRVGLSSI